MTIQNNKRLDKLRKLKDSLCKAVIEIENSNYEITNLYDSSQKEIDIVGLVDEGLLKLSVAVATINNALEEELK